MKRGEMSIGMIIAIIIGVVILVFAIYAITTYKGELNTELDNTISDSTVDDLVLICNDEAQMDRISSFCCDQKTLVTETLNQETTCNEFAAMNISNNRITNLNCDTVVC